MSEAQGSSLVTLLSVGCGLLVLCTFLGLRILSRLKQIENKLSQITRRTESSSTAEIAPSRAETSPGGAFETFLDEDPNRRKLAKGEQFGAYRQWRQDKGMNWSNS